jgi:hypothetical protein
MMFWFNNYSSCNIKKNSLWYIWTNINFIIEIFNKENNSEFLAIISLENKENNHKIMLLKNKKDKLIWKEIEWIFSYNKN